MLSAWNDPERQLSLTCGSQLQVLRCEYMTWRNTGNRKVKRSHARSSSGKRTSGHTGWGWGDRRALGKEQLDTGGGGQRSYGERAAGHKGQWGGAEELWEKNNWTRGGVYGAVL